MKKVEATEQFPPLVAGSFLVDALKGEADEYFQAVTEELAAVVGRFQQVCLQMAKDDPECGERAVKLARRISDFGDSTACDIFSTVREFSEGDSEGCVMPCSIRQALNGDLSSLSIGDMETDWASFVTALMNWARVAEKNKKRIKYSRAWVHILVLACEKDLVS